MADTNNAEATDEALVTRARAGDRAAFELLVRRYQKPLYFFCLRYVKDSEAAADLAQRAFIRVMEKLGDLRDAHTFRAWLFRIGANLALNHLRNHARFVDEDAAAEVADHESVTDALARLESVEESALLRRAVDELPTKQRMTLELRVYEQLSFREVAKVLDTSEGAAKVNFHYAVRRVRALLAAHTPGGQAGGPGDGSGADG